MTENRHFFADGKGRLFAAVEATPFIDADTDEELDLFVSDLLSDADKAEFEERIRKNPDLAAEVDRRKIEIETSPNREQLDRISKIVINKIDLQSDAAMFSVVEHEPVLRRTKTERSAERWRPPNWLLMAAVFVVLAAIGGMIIKRGDRQEPAQNLTLKEKSDVQPSDVTTSDRSSKMKFDATKIIAMLATPVMRTSRFSSANTLPTEDEKTFSTNLLSNLAAYLYSIRRYESHTLFVTERDNIRKEMPFATLPVRFQHESTKLRDQESRTNITAVAKVLKAEAVGFKISIEVHSTESEASEGAISLAQARARELDNLLRESGVPDTCLGEPKGFDSRFISQLTDDTDAANLGDAVVLLIRER